MIKLVLNKAIEEYLNNLKVMLSFGALFVFIILFLFFNQFFLSSGSVFLTYSESIFSIFSLILGLIFLYFFSFFVSITVYSVKRDVQKVSFDAYWSVLLKQAAVKLFLFYFFISIIVYILSIIGLYFELVWYTTIISLIITALTMFAPQSIVLDESDLKQAIKESVLFWKNNLLLNLLIVLIGSGLLIIIVLIEFGLEILSLPGGVISFILVLIFLVPFIEQMKSYAFVLKFNLIKQSEILSAEIKPRKPVKINATRLREQPKGGKI